MSNHSCNEQIFNKFWSLNMDLIKAAFVIRRLVIFGFDYSKSKIRRMYIGVAGYKKRFS